ncbi:MAG: hypothetical protein QMC36_05325 [Patescibacteria group bacterium]
MVAYASFFFTETLLQFGKGERVGKRFGTGILIAALTYAAFSWAGTLWMKSEDGGMVKLSAYAIGTKSSTPPPYDPVRHPCFQQSAAFHDVFGKGMWPIPRADLVAFPEDF